MVRRKRQMAMGMDSADSYYVMQRDKERRPQYMRGKVKIRDKTPKDVKDRFYSCLRQPWAQLRNQLPGISAKDLRAEQEEFFAGRYPTHKDMDIMENFHVSCDIDPDIRGAVLELNKSGYRTAGSCSGHPHHYAGPDRYTGGFISIEVPPAHYTKRDKKRVETILRKHGLTGLKYKEHTQCKRLVKHKKDPTFKVCVPDRSKRARSAPYAYIAYGFKSVGKKMCAKKKRK